VISVGQVPSHVEPPAAGLGLDGAQAQARQAAEAERLLGHAVGHEPRAGAAVLRGGPRPGLARDDGDEDGPRLPERGRAEQQRRQQRIRGLERQQRGSERQRGRLHEEGRAHGERDRPGGRDAPRQNQRRARAHAQHLGPRLATLLRLLLAPMSAWLLSGLRTLLTTITHLDTELSKALLPSRSALLS
jgi:hypothetical protein